MASTIATAAPTTARVGVTAYSGFARAEPDRARPAGGLDVQRNVLQHHVPMRVEDLEAAPLLGAISVEVGEEARGDLVVRSATRRRPSRGR